MLGKTIALWILLSGVAIAAMTRYDLQPGELGHTPSHWPDVAMLSLSPEVPTLLVFLHPMCRCSFATLHELERLVARHPNELKVQVILTVPPEESDWSNSELSLLAQSVTGTKVAVDWNGELAGKFDSKTSGHLALYKTDGDLLFSGGLTAARGHEGRSVGFDEIEAILSRQQKAPVTAPVFGCELVTN